MTSKDIVKLWFNKWEESDFKNLPISDNFKHLSPFGTIESKKAYIEMVQSNKDKFLGYVFEIHDAFYDSNKACVRYTAKQGENFSLDVSEWYYIKNNLIEKIIAHYHIGEIRANRKIEDYDNQ